MIDHVADLLDGGSFGLALIVAASWSMGRRGPAGAVLVGFAATGLLVSGVQEWPAVLAFAASWLVHDGYPAVRPPWGAVAVSLLAAFALYACTPDTELARALCGAVVGAGAVSVVRRVSWTNAAVAVTVLLAAGGAVDGRGRASAVVGGVAIALVHGALQWRPPHRWPLEAVPVVVAGVATLLLSRVAGMADSAEEAVANALPVVAAAGGAALWLARAAPTC